MSKKKELRAKYEAATAAEKKRIVKESGLSSESAYLASLIEKRGRPKKVVTTTTTTTVVTETTEIVDETEEPPYDMVVAFDTTGSMSSYIASVKKHVQELIPRMFSTVKNLRMKIVAFGDYCDMSSKDSFGNAYQDSGMTDNQNLLISFVNSAKNTGGGDGDEFYELVIKKVVQETPWREGSTRTMLLIADCDPHPIGYTYSDRVKNNQIDWRAECRKAADLGIQIDTLSILPQYANIYAEMSKITNGIYLPFKSSEKVSKVMEASSYVRSRGATSKAMYASMSADALASGDEELIGAFKAMDSKL